MTRNIKALGLALIAVFAMTAFIASAAQAAPTVTLKDTNGNTVNSATFTGEETEGKHVFTVEGTNNVECANVVFNGNVTDGATNVTVHPEYNECTAFGFLGATVNTTNCNYRLMANAESSADVFAGEVEVLCNSGAITIEAGGTFGCVASVNNGTVINTGTNATNITTSANIKHEHLKIHNENSQVPTVKNKDGAFCPFAGTGNTTATYNGHTTVKAYTTATNHNEANQVNLTLTK